MESPTSSNRGANLKAHKALPRRRVTSSDSIEKTKEKSPSKRRVSDSHRSDISSWIESASPTLSNTNQPRLPLTPPSLPEDTLRKTLDEPDIPQVTEDERLADNATPVGQMSPLTPDLTPPRMRTRDIPHQRYPSSAAESFKTAREFATSEDSLHRFSSPESDLSTVIQDSAKPTKASFPNGTNPLSDYARNIGLGLRLNMKRGSDATVIPATPEPDSYADIIEDPLIAKETAAVRQVEAENCEEQVSIAEHETGIKSIPQRTESFTATRDGSLLLKHRIVSDRLQAHRRSLHDQLFSQDESRNSTDLASLLPVDVQEPTTVTSASSEQPLLIKVETETTVQVEEEVPESPVDPLVTVIDRQEFTVPAEIKTPTKQRDRRSPEESDIQRLSQISTTSSNIIEAIVITTPRQRRRKLRRSSKNHCLRDVSSPTNGSPRSSLNSTHQVHTLRHKSATLLEKTNRVSLNSDSGISMGYDASTNKDNMIPLSEVPQRRSSLKGQQKNITTTTAEKDKRKSRPATAPERLMSPTGEIMSQMHPIFDTRPHSLRRSSGSRGREIRHAPPVFIPARSSSLSAPTSQNNSRNASMTSDPRKSQDQRRKQSHDPPYRSTSPRVRISLPEQEPAIPMKSTEGLIDPFQSKEEGFTPPTASPHLRSSLIRTPFSAISTPGPVEYGQGTTMPIFPHNNDSLLVVQHSHRPESQDGPIEPQTKQTAFNTPPTRQRQKIIASPRYEDEIPESQEMRRNISATSTSKSVSLNSPSRPSASGKIFNIARTPSGRRHSDIFITPLSRLATTTKNTPPRQRIKIDDPSNTLSPFWRPNGFWNDLSDSEDELDSSDAEDAPERIYVVRNTLGLPQEPVVLGPVGLAKRLGSFRRRKQLQNAAQETDRRSSMPSLQNGLPIVTQGFEITPTKRRGPFSITPITNIYDTLSQRRVEKAEAQQEKRRQRLKNSIGPAMLRDSARRF